MDNVTFFLALWGAFLSTYLAIREVRKDKRSLKIILEHDTWAGMHRLLIINIGHRPVTIDQVSLALGDRKHKQVEAVPQNATWSALHGEPRFPVTLEDGKMAIFYLGTAISSELTDPNKYLKINVFDAESNVYPNYTKGEYDQKYGYRSAKYKPPGFIKSMVTRIQHWWVNRRSKA
jgi:hypothetical protein